MPEIVWLKSDDARILAGTTVRVGSKVKVRGRYYAGGLPSRFKVLQGHGKLVRRFLKERKKPEFTSREEYLDAIETSAMSVVSEALTIPTLGLMHFNASFLLEDDFGNRSPLIYGSKLCGLNIGVSGGAPGASLNVQVGVTAAIDPSVELSVLLPWETEGGGPLTPVLWELGQDLSFAMGGEISIEEAGSDLSEFIRWALPVEPLQGWSFSIPESTLVLSAGEAATTRIEVSAPTSGVTAFAVLARAIIDNEPSGDVAVVSDIAIVEAYENAEVVLVPL